MMKKKVFALMMAGIMVLNVPAFVLAEENTQTEEAAGSEDVTETEETAQTEEYDYESYVYDYSMIDPEVYDGVWLSSFNLFDLYLPSDWEVLVNVGEGEVAEDDVYFQCANADQTRSLTITYTVQEGTTLTSLTKDMEEVGYDDISHVTINDIKVIAYTTYEDGVVLGGILAVDDEGGCYNVLLAAGEDDEEFTSIAQNILYSFSLTESSEE
ncbi:MAG: hypothetical protein HUJ72_02845 [Blautia sp.]|nr:hypothetical protein [Blautia sp.]